MPVKNNEESLQFVLRHYRRRLFDPDSAIGRLRKAVGIDRNWRIRRAVLGLSATAAAVALILSGMALHRSRMNVWEETTASAVVLPDHSTVMLKEGASLAFQPRRFAKDRTVRLSGTSERSSSSTRTAAKSTSARAVSCSRKNSLTRVSK